jgi:exosortase A
MSVGSVAVGFPPATRRSWQLAGVSAAVGILALLAIFHAEARAAVHVWYESTAYGHCFFVLPIALWLAWDRRQAAEVLTPEPVAWPALAALPVIFGWFLADRLGIMEGRQLAAMTLFELLMICVLGVRLSWAFAVPMAYLYFLVPFGAFLTPALQRFTASFVANGLNMLHVPNYVDSFTIEIPEGVFYIAEACAGLRFLIAAIAFGVVYACMIYRSTWKRVVFIGVSCVVPVIANGLRALGTVELGHLLGSAEAAEADHLLYGWIFFSIVILLLVAAGLPFREDQQPMRIVAPAQPLPFHLPRLALGVATVLVLALVGPLAAFAIDRSVGPDPMAALPSFVTPKGCTADNSPAGEQAAGEQNFSCGRTHLTATMMVLPARSSWAQVDATVRAATGEQDATDVTTSSLKVPGVNPSTWRLVDQQEPDRISASALWIDGDPNLSGLSRRLIQARANLLGGVIPPAAVVVAVQPRLFARDEDRQEALKLLVIFLQTQAPLLQHLPP